jgi:hypothetical protein
MSAIAPLAGIGDSPFLRQLLQQRKIAQADAADDAPPPPPPASAAAAAAAGHAVDLTA